MFSSLLPRPRRLWRVVMGAVCNATLCRHYPALICMCVFAMRVYVCVHSCMHACMCAHIGVYASVCSCACGTVGEM